MNGFSLIRTPFDDACLIENFFSGDNRGGFTKIFEKSVYGNLGIDFKIDETFISSSMKNVIRGLHFQTHNPQAKLVSVMNGKIWDVIVDLRPKSMTFKKWYAAVLSAENHRSFFVPRGFAHGFVSLEDNTEVIYLCDGKYDKATDTGIRYDDPDICIEWPIDLKNSIHSKRDLSLQSFHDYLKNPIENI